MPGRASILGLAGLPGLNFTSLLAIDLSKNMAEVTSIGIITGYGMPFIASLYHSWFSIWTWGEIPPHTLTHSPARHVPESQPSFSLNPNPHQSKEDKSSISVFIYCIHFHISHPIQFCPLPHQYFEKVPKILLGSRNPGPGIRIDFCPFSWGSNHSIK